MKIVAISDTHGKHRDIHVPNGDVLVVAGDFLRYGSSEEIPDFREWLEMLPHKKIIVIAGNHDAAFEETPREARRILYGEFGKNKIVYLEDGDVTIDGVKFYGSPWQPDFFNWAFNLPRGEPLKRIWDRIPDDVDVLITHGPPEGVLDHNDHDARFGCSDLLARVTDIKPEVHIFGHAHAAHGSRIHGWEDEDNSITRSFNVAICNENYDPVNPATEIEFGDDEEAKRHRIDLIARLKSEDPDYWR